MFDAHLPARPSDILILMTRFHLVKTWLKKNAQYQTAHSNIFDTILLEISDRAVWGWECVLLGTMSFNPEQWQLATFYISVHFVYGINL